MRKSVSASRRKFTECNFITETEMEMPETYAPSIFHRLPEEGRMGYTKKTLQKFNLIDNFLSNAVAAIEEVCKPFYSLLLSVLLGKELKKVKVWAQQIIPTISPDLRDIRMDVEITESDEVRVASIYDLNPHLRGSLDLPRQNRYYQEKTDSRYVRRGLKDFLQIPNLYVITITDYDTNYH